MKTTTVFIAVLLSTYLSHAGNNDATKNILQTPCGSFGSAQVKGQVEPNNNAKVTAGASEVQYKHSSFQTSDGGTVSFVKFTTKSSMPVMKNIPHVELPGKINAEETSRVSVYPNPTNGDMTVKYFIPKNEKAEFAVFDLSGQKITSYILAGENNQLTISERNLTPGIYLYNVVSNGKIVKQDKIVIIK
jgi:hypothetical protein